MRPSLPLLLHSIGCFLNGPVLLLALCCQMLDFNHIIDALVNVDAIVTSCPSIGLPESLPCTSVQSLQRIPMVYPLAVHKSLVLSFSPRLQWSASPIAVRAPEIYLFESMERQSECLS